MARRNKYPAPPMPPPGGEQPYPVAPSSFGAGGIPPAPPPPGANPMGQNGPGQALPVPPPPPSYPAATPNRDLQATTIAPPPQGQEPVRTSLMGAVQPDRVAGPPGRASIPPAVQSQIGVVSPPPPPQPAPKFTAARTDSRQVPVSRQTMQSRPVPPPPTGREAPALDSLTQIAPQPRPPQSSQVPAGPVTLPATRLPVPPMPASVPTPGLVPKSGPVPPPPSSVPPAPRTLTPSTPVASLQVASVPAPPAPVISAPSSLPPQVAPMPSRQAPPTTTASVPIPALQRPPQADEAEENTILAKRRQKTSTLLTPDGKRIPLKSTTVVIGRKLMRGDHPIGVQLINVSDPTRTVSKTHATLLRTGDDWRIRDEDSTNGVYLVKEDGTETEVKSEGPLSGRFVLGDLVFELETDG